MLRYIERSESGCTGVHGSTTAELDQGLGEGTKAKTLVWVVNTIFSYLNVQENNPVLCTAASLQINKVRDRLSLFVNCPVFFLNSNNENNDVPHSYIVIIYTYTHIFSIYL